MLVTFPATIMEEKITHTKWSLKETIVHFHESWNKGQKSLLSKSWHSLTLDQLGIFMILPFSHWWNKHRPIQPQSWVSDLTDESEAITLCSFLVQYWLLNWRFLLGIVSAQKSCSFLLTSVPNFIGNLTNFQKGPSDIQLAMTFATSKTLGTCCPVFHVLPPMFGMLVCLSLQLWYDVYVISLSTKFKQCFLSLFWCLIHWPFFHELACSSPSWSTKARERLMLVFTAYISLTPQTKIEKNPNITTFAPCATHMKPKPSFYSSTKNLDIRFQENIHLIRWAW